MHTTDELLEANVANLLIGVLEVAENDLSAIANGAPQIDVGRSDCECVPVRVSTAFVSVQLVEAVNNFSLEGVKILKLAIFKAFEGSYLILDGEIVLIFFFLRVLRLCLGLKLALCLALCLAP